MTLQIKTAPVHSPKGKPRSIDMGMSTCVVDNNRSAACDGTSPFDLGCGHAKSPRSPARFKTRLDRTDLVISASTYSHIDLIVACCEL